MGENVNNKFMLGQKWIKKNELLKIDIEPNSSIKIYEESRGDLLYLQQDLKKYGSKIRREEDSNNLLESYNKYLSNNEIYLIDIYHDLGLFYNNNNIRNLYDVYIKIY